MDCGNTVVGQRLDLLIRFFLYILIFWLPYSQAVIESCVITASILWLIKRVIYLKDVLSAKRDVHVLGPPSNFLNRPIAYFIFVCIFSVSGSIFLKESAYGFITKTLEWFAVFYLILEVFTERRHIFIAFFIFMFSVSAVILDSFVQFYLTHKDIFYGYALTPRGATAGFTHPNQLAGLLIFILSISFSFLFWQEAKQKSRFFFFLFFILTVWSLAMTLSRGGWFGAVCGVLFCSYLINKRLFKKFLLGGLLFVSLLYLALPIDTKRHFRVDQVNNVQAVSWRLGVWADSLVMIREAPLFGHGINTYMRLFQYYRRKPSETSPVGPTYAHNCFIQVAAETGILGLIGFLWIMVRLFRNTVRKWNAAKDASFSAAKNENSFFLYLLIGLLSGTAGFLVQSFFDTNLYSLRLSVLFWLMIGLCVSIDRLIVLDKRRI